MIKKTKKTLYNISRKSGKVASILTDIELTLEGKFDKLAKRKVKKQINKQARKITNNLFK